MLCFAVGAQANPERPRISSPRFNASGRALEFRRALIAEPNGFFIYAAPGFLRREPRPGVGSHPRLDHLTLSLLLRRAKYCTQATPALLCLRSLTQHHHYHHPYPSLRNPPFHRRHCASPAGAMAALGDDLLGTVNKLQDLVFNTIGNDSLDLPQIVRTTQRHEYLRLRQHQCRFLTSY